MIASTVSFESVIFQVTGTRMWILGWGEGSYEEGSVLFLNSPHVIPLSYIISLWKIVMVIVVSSREYIPGE